MEITHLSSAKGKTANEKAQTPITVLPLIQKHVISKRIASMGTTCSIILEDA